jgi:hypothetical protein
LNLRSGYGSSDFDRTNVINFDYVYTFPDFIRGHSILAKAVNGFALEGITVLQSGQPYSVEDYTGSVGSQYYSNNDGITNPIIPLAPGVSPHQALTGRSGAFYASDATDVALNPNAFSIPFLNPGQSNVPACGVSTAGAPVCDVFESNFGPGGQRNIFRQSFQKRGDASLVKVTKFSDRYSLKYTFDVYNLTNTSSFDVPGDNVSQNYDFNNGPGPVGTYTSVLPQGDVCSTNPDSTIPGGSANTFYTCPIGLGLVTRTIGSPRQIQMSLSFLF